MPPLVNELPKANPSNTEVDASTLAEMRKRVSEIASDLSEIAERRARAARQSLEEGADTVRATIRKQPVVSVGIATLAGALLAVLIVPRSTPTRRSTAWTDWSPVTRADLHDFADTVQRSLTRSLNSVPMTSSLERLADAVSRVDNSAGVSSAIEKIGAWLQQKAPSTTAKK